MKPDITHFRPQTGKLKREFRLSAIHKGEKSKWLNGTERYDWYYIFKYIDNGSFFGLYEDLSNNISKKLNHKEVQDLLCN